MPVPDEITDWVERLHRVVDELVAPIVAAHGSRIRCQRGCAGCCTDGLTVFAIEAAVIERHHAHLLAGGAPHAEGACAFLDEAGACRIYEHRPYVCRTQGLPLRWLEQDEGGPVEVRDICALSAEGTPLEDLGAEQCWTLGPFEDRLGARQVSIDTSDASERERVALRSLFRDPGRHS